MFLYQNENEFKCTLCGQSKYLEDLCDGENSEYISENYGDVCKACYDYHFKDFSLEEMQAVSESKDMLSYIFGVLPFNEINFVDEETGEQTTFTRYDEEDDVDLDEDLWGNW
jgi:hypothetical protein